MVKHAATNEGELNAQSEDRYRTGGSRCTPFTQLNYPTHWVRLQRGPKFYHPSNKETTAKDLRIWQGWHGLLPGLEGHDEDHQAAVLGILGCCSGV